MPTPSRALSERAIQRHRDWRDSFPGDGRRDQWSVIPVFWRSLSKHSRKVPLFAGGTPDRRSHEHGTSEAMRIGPLRAGASPRHSCGIRHNLVARPPETLKTMRYGIGPGLALPGEQDGRIDEPGWESRHG